MASQLEFLPGEPPPRVVRLIAGLVLSIVGAALLFVTLVPFPETISSRFTLIPARAVDPLRALDDSVVSRVYLQEGQQAKKGDPVYDIVSRLSGDRMSEFRALQARIEGGQQQLQNAENQYRSTRAADGREQALLERKLEDLRHKLALQTERLALRRQQDQRFSAMQQNQTLSISDLETRQLETNRISQELADTTVVWHETDYMLQGLIDKIEARHHQHQENLRQIQERIAEDRERAALLYSEHESSQAGATHLQAPCDGTLIQQNVKSDGSVVIGGEVLGEFACRDQAIKAEILIPAAQAGRIHTGQSIKLLYDAFPYQRYGAGYSRIAWLSPAGLHMAASESGGAWVFKAFSQPVDGGLAFSADAPGLRVGMGGTARIVVGQRTVLARALDPLNKIKESLRSVPEQRDQVAP